MNDVKYFLETQPQIASAELNKETSSRHPFMSMKNFCVFGYLTGSMPFKGLIFAKTSVTIAFKKLSVVYLLSWIILFAKALILFEVVSIVQNGLIISELRFNSTGPGLQPIIGLKSMTGLVSKIVGFLSTFSFGLVAHILQIFCSKRFLKVNQLLESYDEIYPSKKPAKLFNCLVMGSIVCSLLICKSFIILTYACLTDPLMAMVPQEMYFLKVIPLPSVWTVCVNHYIALLLIEYAVVLLYIQILYLSNVLSSRLQDIIGEIEASTYDNGDIVVDNYNFKAGRTSLNISKDNLKFNKLQAWMKNSGSPLNVAWKTLGSRYMELEKVFRAYEDFVGFPLITIFVFLIATTVCLLYGDVTSAPWIGEMLGKAFVGGMTSVSVFRVNALTSVGEGFNQQQENLVKAAMKVGQMDEMPEKERIEFDRFVKLITTIRINLSAGGFFNVHRGNVASIVSVIITYIVVLIKFRQSE